jgi:hypothetical protein
MSFRVQVSGWEGFQGLPQKVMVLGYFADTKGVVGCEYVSRLAFKMRDLKRFLKLNFCEYFYDP